jgi:hypothetical protein
MREPTDKKKIDEFMRELGRRARAECRVYLTGGATAVLLGWRDSTIDIDLRFEPELDEIFRALPEIKESLDLNIELAAPPDFIPPLPNWRDRCAFVRREGKVSFFNYDPYAQALAKIERGHEQDMSDVRMMFETGLITREKVIEMFEQIRPLLYKYPAIDPEKFASSVLQAIKS